VSWPRDDAKLDRVRAALADHDLDALVVRAPDNVLYLTNYWGMKGYEVAIFPREGDPTLVVMEPSIDDAERNAWTADHRAILGYDPADPRPPAARALARAQEVVHQQGYGRVGLELSLGTQAADRMVGEPTTYTKAFFDAFDGAADATPLLNACRARKTDQELERMRLANAIADAALAHVHERLRPGMKESEVAALWEGAVHAIGVGYQNRVEMARGIMQPTPVGQACRHRCARPVLTLGHHRRFPHPLKTHRCRGPGDAIRALRAPAQGSAG